MNERLLDYASASAAADHTRQRHRDILKGYRQEFTKIEENHQMRVERESLLGGGGIAALGGSNSGLSRRDMYLKENQHVHKYAKMTVACCNNVCLMLTSPVSVCDRPARTV